MKLNLKKILPHLIAIAGFLLIISVYFSPVFENKTLRQHDILMAKAMQHEIKSNLDNTGELTLWTNSIFGGMPTYMIWVKYPANIASQLNYLIRLYLPDPIGLVFVYFICFYILMIVLGATVPISFIGSLAFAFASYNFVNIEAGHVTKALAVGLAPLVLAGIFLALQRKYLLGLLITAVALAMEIRANHLQITYYLAIMILILMIVEFIHVFKKKEFTEFIKSIAVLGLAAILAVGVNITSLWTANEYTKYTMRGGSELAAKQADGKGLEKDYALSWSYGLRESFTLLIPYFSGGATSETLGPKSKLAEYGVEKANLKNVPTYWGTMSSTAGPIYVGAIMLFLFVLGMFIVKSRYKWWLFSTAILSLMLSWGSNFQFLTDIFFNNFPLYNKFRVPMTWLLIVSLTVPILSALAIQEFMNGQTKKEELIKYLKYTFYGVGGLSLFFALFGGTLFNFVSSVDEIMEKNGWPVDVIRSDRARLLKMDAFRSFFFILVVAASLFAFLKKKLKANYVVGIIIVFVLIDMWGVNRRYFNDDDFHRKSRMNKEYIESTAADRVVLQDNDPNFRVLDLTTNPWADATKAYYFKLVGGYHGAKMARYQDMIEKHFSPELDALADELKKTGIVLPQLTPTLNMMNTKYYIAGDAPQAVLKNPGAFGNAWFVDGSIMAKNADEEIDTLDNFDLRRVAVIDKAFEKELKGFSFVKDSAATIALSEYKPSNLKYKSNSSSAQMAVFSEIFYDKGWNAFIDGEKVPHFRVDYLLRAMIIPAGAHDIEFKFEPKSYYIGEKIAGVFSILILLIAAFTIYYYVKPLITKKNDSVKV